MLKGQDIVVLSALMGNEAQESYAELSIRSCLSVSETHAAVSRLRAVALLNGGRRVIRSNALEFLLHGLRYAFPLRSTGKLAKGMATSYAAPVAENYFAATGARPVWGTPEGDAYGQAFEPLYATVPKAAAKDKCLYDRLALLDMLRGGRLRERQFAEKKLVEMLP